MALELQRTQDVVKTLAAAANAARLYPPASMLPAQAVERFVQSAAGALADGGTLQVTVEPNGFTWGDAALGDGQSNIVAFAETLYAHQVGRLIVAPGLSADEAALFLRCVAADPHAVKDAGGLRSVVKKAGIAHLAVIEVTLRAATEEGLAGIDLTTAPLEEIAPRVAAAAAGWEETASEGEGRDEIAGTIGSMEEAARELVAQRIAEALLRLDEATRMRAVAAAFNMDATGEPMTGMLDVLARMKPAALARLLTLVANDRGIATPSSLAGALKLPPEAMRAVMLLLAPSAQPETARGVPAEADATTLAKAVAEENEAETADLGRQISRSAPRMAAGRALMTTVQLAQARHTEEAVTAVGDALEPAVRAGAFAEVRAACGYLSGLGSDVALSQPAARARQRLADPELMRFCIGALSHGMDPDVVGAVLSAAGPVGADAMIAAYLGADASTRPRLQPVLRSMGDVVVAAASRRIKDADSKTAIELITVLVSVGDKRTVPILRQALDHVDYAVRRACLAALAEMGGTESEQLLVGALSHWDPETRRVAAREIGRAGAVSAIPAMLYILQGYYFFEQNYSLKKDVIGSLEMLGSPAAVPTLRRMAGRKFVVGRKNRELRFLARGALAGIEATFNDRGEKAS